MNRKEVLSRRMCEWGRGRGRGKMVTVVVLMMMNK